MSDTLRPQTRSRRALPGLPNLQLPEPLEQSRAKTEIENRGSEETKLDHVLGKTTAAETDPAITDRLIALAKGERPERDRTPALGEDGFATLLRSAYRNGTITRSEWLDRVSLHGFVLHSGPLEGEAGVLADLQALVDAGVGEWREDDAEGKR